MQVKAGDGLEFVQDEDSGEWYVTVNNEKGYSLVEKGSKSYLRCVKMVVSNAISETYELELPLKFQLELEVIKKEKLYKLIPMWDEPEDEGSVDETKDN